MTLHYVGQLSYSKRRTDAVSQLKRRLTHVYLSSLKNSRHVKQQRVVEYTPRRRLQRSEYRHITEAALSLRYISETS